jgi:hypothetical protein
MVFFQKTWIQTHNYVYFFQINFGLKIVLPKFALRNQKLEFKNNNINGKSQVSIKENQIKRS